MSMTFQKATKKSARLRMALIGVAGAGKTYTALSIAQNLGQKVAVVDTERGSASKYSDLFDFDVMEMESYGPKMYVDAIKAAEEAGYDVLIIDSLSHAWAGKDGALEMVDRAAKRAQSGNTFGAWRDVSPLHNQMVDAIVSSRIHILATMRAKTEYVQEKDPKSGRTTVRKIGLAPVQRDGLEYEFDVVALINAGALRPGTLESGDIERNDLVKLLAFGEDKIVSVVITGAQLHAALERAASVYPTASPAFLQVAGLTATFNPDSAVGSRVSRIKVGASALSDTKTYRAAMPVSLAQGAAGYFNIWNGAQSSPTDVQLIDAVGGYIRGQKEVTPESQTRFGPA